MVYDLYVYDKEEWLWTQLTYPEKAVNDELVKREAVEQATKWSANWSELRVYPQQSAWKATHRHDANWVKP